VDGVIAILCRKRSIPESMGELPIRYNTEWHSALIGSFFRKMLWVWCVASTGGQSAWYRLHGAFALDSLCGYSFGFKDNRAGTLDPCFVIPWRSVVSF
jgi:hypothetical protein